MPRYEEAYGTFDLDAEAEKLRAKLFALGRLGSDADIWEVRTTRQ